GTRPPARRGNLADACLLDGRHGRRRARLRAGAEGRVADRVRRSGRLRPYGRAEHRACLPAGRARRGRDGADRRHHRRARAGDGRCTAPLRSSEPAAPLVTTSTNPYQPVRWKLVPGHTALVIIDAQRDFLDPEGWYAQSGVDISHMRRVIEPTRELLAVARVARVPVVWTRHGYKDGTDGGPFMELRPFLRDGGLRQSPWGY